MQRKKSTTVTQNKFFECQMHERGTKVKIIPGAPCCYSYNSLFEFQQIWVSVPIQKTKQAERETKAYHTTFLRSIHAILVLFWVLFPSPPPFWTESGCFIHNYHQKKTPLNCIRLSSKFSPVPCSDGEMWLNSKDDFFYLAPLQHQAEVSVAITNA